MNLRVTLRHSNDYNRFYCAHLLEQYRQTRFDSNVLALFLDYPENIVATDDKRLRNVCRALGARVTGTLGFIIYSVETGKLAKDEAIKLLRELDAMGFRMNIGLYEKARETIEKAP